MRRSIPLRNLLILIITSVVLLAILFSFVLSYLFTSTRFNVLITENNKSFAEEIAPIIQDFYQQENNWNAVLSILEYSAENPPVEFFEDYWISDLDWVDIIEKQGLSPEVIEDGYWQGQSLAEIATANSVDPNEIYDAILSAEMNAAEEAYNIGEISLNQFNASNSTTPRIIYDYMYTSSNNVGVESGVIEINYDSLEESLAEALGLDVETLFDKLYSGEGILPLISALGVDTEIFIDTVIALEIEKNYKNMESVGDLEHLRNELRFILYDYIQPVYLENAYLTPDAINYLLFTLLDSNQRLLLADADNIVRYDSAEELTGKLIGYELTDQGVPIYKSDEIQQAGVVIVASGPDYYNDQQRLFIQSIQQSFLISGAVIGLLGFLAAIFLSGRLSAPIKALTKASEQITRGENPKPLPLTNQKELALMSGSFNKMANELNNQRELRKQIVSNFSHEVNTPLSVIQLELQALIDGFQYGEEAEVQINKEILILRSLINDLDMLNQIVDEGSNFTKQDIDMETFLNALKERWVSPLSAEKRDLIIQKGNVPNLFQGNEIRLQQVFGNLIQNALKYSPEKSKIFINIQTITEDHQDWLKFVVKDEGTGISEEDLPYVFDRFYRADSARQRSMGGRGLGLAISKEIIIQHNGQIWAENNQPSGTKIILMLPL